MKKILLPAIILLCSFSQITPRHSALFAVRCDTLKKTFCGLLMDEWLNPVTYIVDVRSSPSVCQYGWKGDKTGCDRIINYRWINTDTTAKFIFDMPDNNNYRSGWYDATGKTMNLLDTDSVFVYTWTVSKFSNSDPNY